MHPSGTEVALAFAPVQTNLKTKGSANKKSVVVCNYTWNHRAACTVDGSYIGTWRLQGLNYMREISEQYYTIGSRRISADSTDSQDPVFIVTKVKVVYLRLFPKGTWFPSTKFLRIVVKKCQWRKRLTEKSDLCHRKVISCKEARSIINWYHQ